MNADTTAPRDVRVMLAIDELQTKYDKWKPWYDSVVEYVVGGLSPRLARLADMGSNRTRNVDYGIRVNFGRRQGHTTLAQMLASEFDDVVVIVHHEEDEKRFVKPNTELLQPRVWVSRPLDIVPQEASGWSRDDVVNRAYPPLKDARVCVVDGASGMSLDELELLRAAKWGAYIELS